MEVLSKSEPPPGDVKPKNLAANFTAVQQPSTSSTFRTPQTSTRKRPSARILHSGGETMPDCKFFILIYNSCKII